MYNWLLYFFSLINRLFNDKESTKIHDECNIALDNKVKMINDHDYYMFKHDSDCISVERQ